MTLLISCIFNNIVCNRLTDVDKTSIRKERQAERCLFYLKPHIIIRSKVISLSKHTSRVLFCLRVHRSASLAKLPSIRLVTLTLQTVSMKRCNGTPMEILHLFCKPWLFGIYVP